MNKYLPQKLISYPKLSLLIVILLFLTSYSGLAQTGSVKGKITDATTGEELIGANVLIQGTTKGTTTDVNGNYSLDGLEKGSYNLVISYVSYEQIDPEGRSKKR